MVLFTNPKGLIASAFRAAVLLAPPLTAATAAPVQVVVVGDSNIEGKGVATSDAYPAQLERALRAKGLDVSVSNAGRNGDTSYGVLARLDRAVPDGTAVAIVSVGINDVVVFQKSVESARANVAEIASRLRARGIEVLVFPTGKKFHGTMADDPAYHVEGVPGKSGPVAGTTQWHLTSAGYARVVTATLPQVMAAINKAKKKPKAN